ncbi:TPM domain-containing protein [Planococcus liqunii]|uniref:TPM domain-containing protein n=1 Tax=Planococcus liqunii TaxID=3058394 RepID=UPI00261A5855|nr:TPM domain-containing protein [Planococcus sp. N056]WKA52153.1 TPM domain-containing protein [Planococcus sp. N056]
MMKKWMVLFGIFSFMAAAPVLAFEFPELAGDIYIQDIAGVLTPEEEEELRQLGRELEDATTAQLAVMVVPTLDGEPIADYAVEALRHYGVGTKEENNGVLMVVSTGDREIYISTGYGLEAVLPDGKVGRILDDYAVSHLKQNDFGAGIKDTYKALHEEIGTTYGWDAELAVPQPLTQQPSGAEEKDVWLIPRLILVGIFVIWILVSLFGDGAGRGNSKSAGKRSPSSSRRSSSSRSGRGGSGGGGGAGRKF